MVFSKKNSTPQDHFPVLQAKISFSRDLPFRQVILKKFFGRICGSALVLGKNAQTPAGSGLLPWEPAFVIEV
jgi:hypothetical protein